MLPALQRYDGEPVIPYCLIKGTRITVEFVFELLAACYTPQEVRDQCDQMTLDDIRACLARAKEMIHSERVYAIKR